MMWVAITGTIGAMKIPSRITFLAAVAALCTTAYTQDPPDWPDTYVARLQVLALLQTFSGEVLASGSSTLTLEKWCREHELAPKPLISAEVVKAVEKTASAAQRQDLQVADAELLKYR